MTQPGDASAPDLANQPEVPRGLPWGWSSARPDEQDAEQLAALLRRHEQRARGWATTEVEDVLVQVSARGYRTRRHLVLRDPHSQVRGWAAARDRAAGRMLLGLVVDPALDDGLADRVADSLLGWADATALEVGAARGLTTQQVDCEAFAGDEAAQRWLTRAGFERVRTWWQMSRPVVAEEADLDVGLRPGVRIRRVLQEEGGIPDEQDLHIVHDVLESAFADHFNSHAETFDEFVSRLREDPGHRWDHWWVAELAGDEQGVAGRDQPEPAGALVASVSVGHGGAADGSYVDYLGVLANARGRGVAKSLLRTVIADAAARGRDRVGLEVDADSPTGADGLYVAMGWTTSYVTESWHRDVAVPAG